MSINPFNNTRRTLYVIGAFLIVFFGFRACEAEAETIVEGGVSIVSLETEGYALGITERFAGKYDIGVNLIGEQTTHGEKIDNNFIVHADRVVTWQNLELNLGLAYWQNENRLSGCDTGFSMGGAVNLSESLAIRYRHFSNAGTCSPNVGQDMLLVSWKFGD
jgi:hypothetical protein